MPEYSKNQDQLVSCSSQIGSRDNMKIQEQFDDARNNQELHLPTSSKHHQTPHHAVHHLHLLQASPKFHLQFAKQQMNKAYQNPKQPYPPKASHFLHLLFLLLHPSPSPSLAASPNHPLPQNKKPQNPTKKLPTFFSLSQKFCFFL
uniref:Uncharacterized protein n=1 Tax=Medicago truncatula TaxID=3880 RepID=I3SIP3_MEDTR|nr:unknown [Medicago truncatula]